jgi:hypothetical protein
MKEVFEADKLKSTENEVSAHSAVTSGVTEELVGGRTSIRKRGQYRAEERGVKWVTEWRKYKKLGKK